MFHGTALPLVGETVGTGDTLGVGTADAALTPRLPISLDPIGIPARAPPLVVAGEVEVGLDDAATLLEPEPHIPVNPDVSGIPEDVDSPDVAEIAVEVDIPDEADVPSIAAVVGVVVAVVIPPPS